MIEHKTDSDPVITDERRCRVQLAAELLQAAEDPANKSTLFRRANLNHTRGSRYLSALRSGDLLSEQRDRFELTSKGEDFVRRWERIQDALNGADD